MALHPSAPSTPAQPDAGGLRISGVRKTFGTPEGGEVHALDGVDLSIRPGEFFVLLGPSGCGKTTLLRSIAGLEHLDEGEISLDGERIDQLPPHRRPVNTVFQSYALFPTMTVAQNIAFGLEMDKAEGSRITETVERMLRLVRLEDKGSRRPAQLSGGQQQRVALARALAKTPRVLLLDEPLAALDLKLRRGMQEELKAIQQTTGVTFVFVTHDQEEALSLGDRIAVFDSGRIAQVGSPAEIYERPVNRFVAEFIGETSFVDVDVRVDDGQTVATLPDGQRAPWELSGVPGQGRRTLAVRPERVRLTPAEAPAPPDSLPGRVLSTLYMGTDQRVLVQVGGAQLRARVPASADPVREDQQVHVHVPPGHLRLLEDEPR